MRRNRIVHTAAFTAFATHVAAFSNPHIFERSSTCLDTSLTQCQGVPDNFCCPSNTNCLVLASNTTVLCCPSGEDCSLIQTIVCDVSQQNATAFPDAQLKTTNLTATLPTCNGRCCPLGYSCTAANICALNPNQGTAPSHTSLAPSATSTPTISPANSASAPSSTSSTTPITPACSKFPAGAVIAGFFPGLALGALLSILSICLLGAHRARHPSRPSSARPTSNATSSSFGGGGSGGGKFGASISEPILHESSNSAMRTDFIRKLPSPARQPTLRRVRSLFRRSEASTKSNSTNTDIYLRNQTSATPIPPVPRPPMPPMPVTPRMQRQLSGESINVFADPSTAQSLDVEMNRGAGGVGGGLGARLGVGERNVRASAQTTFTDMMERAELGGVRRGEGFVETPSPGQAKRWR